VKSKNDDSEELGEDAPSYTHGTSRGDEVVERILRRGERAEALGAAETHGYNSYDGDQFEAEDRSALKRVSGLSTELQDITDVYTIMNSVFLVTILLLDIYVICFRLRFKLDPAGYLILLTQLVVLIFRLWMGRSSIYIHWQQWLQASVIYVGYIINETTLMFFMFEMKYVKL
jgi:hypothetical protein